MGGYGGNYGNGKVNFTRNVVSYEITRRARCSTKSTMFISLSRGLPFLYLMSKPIQKHFTSGAREYFQTSLIGP